MPSPLTAFQRERRIYKAKGTPSLSEDELSALPGSSEEAIGITATETVATSIKDVAHSLDRITGAINVASIDAVGAFSREDAKELVKTFVGAALHIADSVGLVVTVESRPHHHLAMGAYDSVVDVRDHRKVYNAHLYEEDAPASVSREIRELGQDETGETYYAVCTSPVALGHPMAPPLLHLSKEEQRAFNGGDLATAFPQPFRASTESKDAVRLQPEPPLAGDFGTYEHPYAVPYHPV